MASSIAMRGVWALLILCLMTAAWANQPATPASSPVPPVITHYQLRSDRTGCQPNWFTGQLEVVGIGYAVGTGDAAKYQALAVGQTIMRLEAARGLAKLSLDGSSTLGSLTDETTHRLIDQLLDNLTIVDEKWDAQLGAYAVVGVIPLYGPNGVTVLGVKKAALTDPLLEVKELELSLLTPMPVGFTPQPFTAPYTGVIVDCDRLVISPCLFPDLLRTDGKPCWVPLPILIPCDSPMGKYAMRPIGRRHWHKGWPANTPSSSPRSAPARGAIRC